MNTFTPEVKATQALKLFALIGILMIFSFQGMGQVSISGPLTVCTGAGATATYTCVTTAPPGTFTWSTYCIQPIGCTVTMTGENTQTVMIDWGNSAKIVELTVTDPDNVSATVTVTVGVSSPTITGEDTVCVSVSHVYAITQQFGWETYYWSIDGGSWTSGTSTNVTFATIGTHTITVYATMPGANSTTCTSATYTMTVIVNDAPTSGVVGGPTFICCNSSANFTAPDPPSGYTYYSFNWSLASTAGCVTTWTGQGTKTITVTTGTASGTATISVSYSNVGNGGCTTTTTEKIVTISLPTPSISGTSPVCPNIAYVYTASGASSSTYSWSVTSSGATGSPTSGSGNIFTITWSNNTSISQICTITLTEQNGTCTGTTEKTITVYPIPTLNAINNQTHCVGATVPATPFIGLLTSGDWTNNNLNIGLGGGGNNVSSVPSFTASNTTTSPITGNISVTPRANGCYGIPSGYTITVNPNVGTPTTITITAGTEPTCQIIPGTSSTTYASSTTNGTITFAVDPTEAGTIGSSSGIMTWQTGFYGTATITATAGGCATQTTQRTVVITPTVGTPTAITVSAGTEPTCQLTTSTVTTSYSTTSTNNTGFNWSISNPSAGVIGASSGVMTWTNGFSGTVDIQVTANGCNGPSAQVTKTVYITPSVSIIPFIPSTSSRCQGASEATYTTTATNSTGITYSLDATSLAAGNTISSTTGAVTYVANWAGTSTITASAAGCNGPVTTVHIATTHPTPVMTTANTKTICSGSNTNIILSATTTSTYTWTIGSNIRVTGFSAGSGTTISQVLTNTTNTTTGYVEYIVVPTSSAGACVGSPFTITVTVNPIPSVTTANASTICSGADPNILLTATASSTFEWTLGNISGGITGAAAGSGYTITQVLTNTSNSTAGSVEYVVVPTYTGSACTGSPYTITVTVNPKPVVTNPSTMVICNGTSPNIVLSASTPSSFNWTIGSVTPGITGATGGSGGLINQVLTNTNTSTTGIVEYLVTPTSTGGPCTGSVYTITVTVNPTPVVTTPNTKSICDGSGTNINLTATAPSSFAWTIGTVSGVLGATFGSGNSINQELTLSNSSVQGSVEYVVVPTYLSSSCTGPAYTITVTVNPRPVMQTPATKSICSGTNTNIGLTASIPSTFVWTIGAVTGNITGASGGSGATITQVLTNPGNSNPGTVEYLVVPTSTAGSCAGVVFTITVTVNPVPVVITPNSATICSGNNTNINLTSSVSSSFAWIPGSVNNVSGATAGIGSTISQLLTATTNAPGTAEYVVTAMSTGGLCSSSAYTITVTVNPNGQVDQPVSTVVCNGNITSAISFTTTNTVGTTTYTWTNTNATIGLPATGTGTIASFTAINSGTSPAIAIIEVTPHFAFGSVSCPGATKSFTITVNPSAQVNQPGSQVVCNNSATAAVAFTTNNTGGTTTFNWTNSNTAIGLAASGTGDIATFTATNTGTTPATATIVVTPLFTNGPVSCPGSVKTFTITVNPTAQVDQPASQLVCNGGTTSAVTFTTVNTGGITTYSWSNDNTAIGLAATGTVSIPGFTAINSTNAPVVANITVTPNYSNGSVTCSGLPKTFSITVNPSGQVNQPGNMILCHGGISNQVTFTTVNTGGTTSYSWNNSNPSIGLAASGTGNIPSFTAVNTGVTPIIALITVTPQFSNGSVACTGSVKTFTITVNPAAPTPVVIGSSEICQGYSGVVYRTDANMTAYNWNVTGGTITAGATTNAITVTWNTAGVQTITVSYIHTSGCLVANPGVKTVNVFPVNAATISSYPPDACTGNTMYYSTETTMSTYQWNISPGGTVIPGTWTSTIGVIWNNTGTQTVTVSYLNENDCPVQATRTITVNTTPVVTITGPAESCLNETKTYSTQPGNSLYTWEVGAGGTITSGLGTYSITVLWTTAGTRTVTVNYTDPAGGCRPANPATKTVTVYDPVPTITGPSVACVGNSGTVYYTENNMSNYQWSVSSTGYIVGGISNLATVTVEWISTTLGLIDLIYTDDHGCQSNMKRKEVTIYDRPPNPVISGDLVACTESTITYSTQPGMNNYTWSVSAGGSIITSPTTTANEISVIWNTPGVKNVSVNYSNIAGCSALVPAIYTTTVYSRPVPTLSGVAVCCLNSANNIYTTQSGNSNYIWNDLQAQGGIVTAGGTTTSNYVIVTWTTTGVKTVTVNYQNLYCYGYTEATYTTTVNALPTVYQVAGQVLCSGTQSAPVTFSGSIQGTVFNWTNSNSSIGLASAGSGNIPAFTATNYSTMPVTATITVTPSYTTGGVTCTGVPVSFTIIVNPTPTVNPVTSQFVCNGAPTTAINFTGTVAGTVFSWSNTTPSIGLAGSGTGDIGTFTATNNTAVPVTATITVTPVYNNNGTTCYGPDITFNITVYAQFVAGSAVATQTICRNTIPNTLTATAPSGGSSPYSYNWQSSMDNMVFSNIPAATNLTYQPGTMTMTTWYRNAQTSSDNGGTVYTNPVLLTVNPLPVPTIAGEGMVCLNSVGNIYSTQPGMSGYLWNVTGGIITSGQGTSSVLVTWTTAGIQTISVNYINANGCTAASPTVMSVSVQSLLTPTISGPDPACTGFQNVYTTETGMTNYVWTLPAGGGYFNGSTASNTVTVIWTNSGSRSIMVNYTSQLGCGTLTPTVKTVTVNASPPAPTITGTGSICSGTTGVTYFTEQGMYNYTWTVTGGTITSGQGSFSIQVHWITPGLQTVTVNYSNASGCSSPNVTVKSVNVSATTVPVISGSTAVCTGTSVNYTTELGMTSYSWALSSGGSIVSGGNTSNAMIQWQSAGTHTITVSYINAAGCPTIVPGTLVVQANQSPVPIINGASSVCKNGSINFWTEPGMALYNWNVGSGSILAGAGTNSITVMWTQAGTQTVTVIYTNPSAACQALVPTMKPVVVHPLPVPVIAGPLYGCTGGTGIPFSTESGMSNYVWSATLGGIITSGSGTSNVTVLWNNPGAPQVFVTYTDGNGCQSELSQANITINTRPADPVITGQGSVCVGSTTTYSTQPGMVTYDWNVSPGGTIITSLPMYTNTITVLWNTAGTQTVTVNYTDPGGCSSLNPATFTVTVNPQPVPVISGPSTVCVNSTSNTYATASGQTNYSWTVSSGGTITAGGTSTSNFVVITWTTAGQKTITVNYTNGFGCRASIAGTYTVTVRSLPVPTISGPATACQNVPGQVYITEPGMSGYLWNAGTGGTIVAGQGTRSITVTWLSPGSRSVTVSYSDPYGCMAMNPTIFPVLVNQMPSPTITSFSDPTDVVCENTGGHIYFTEPGMASYFWTVTGPAGTSILSGQNASTTNIHWGGPGPATGTLQVHVTNINQCSASSSVKTVTITPQVPASVTIVASQNPVLVGNPVTFTATAINGGSAPVYQWNVNGINVGPNSPAYTYVPANGDLVKCIVTSNQICVNNNPATSNTITMTITYGVPCPGIPTVLYQGITYHTVQIGDQCWLKENLNVGSMIQGIQEQTNNGIIEKYCYDNLPSNCEIYGGLYQWNEMMQYSTAPSVRGICPEGWHLASDDEWSVLTTGQGGEPIAGGKIKEVGIDHWLSPNTGAVNSTGFTGLGGGLRYANGTFGSIREFGYFMTSSQNSLTNAWSRYLAYNLNSVNRNLNNKSLGFSARCLKDNCASYPPVSVTISAASNPVCSGANVLFSAYPVNGGSAPVYQWKVNGNNVGTNNQTFMYVPSNNDVITCVLTSNLPAPCLSGNPATSNAITMTVNSLPVPTISGPSTVCTGAVGSDYYTETGMSAYNWIVSQGGTIVSGLGTRSITVIWTSSGAQSVSVNYVNGTGCAALQPTVKAVMVNPAPVPTITGLSQGCLGTTISYNTESGKSNYIWTVGAGGVITSGQGTQAIMVRWNQSGNWTVNVSYNDPVTGCGSVIPASRTVTVFPLPIPSVAGPSTSCVGSTGNIYITETGMTGYVWTISSGGTITSGQGTGAISVTWNTAGSQFVTVNYVNANGCSAAAPSMKSVMVTTPPVPLITGSSSACVQELKTYSTESGMSGYVWNISPDGTILAGSNTATITVQWQVAGLKNVRVSYTNQNGCTGISAVKTVTVNGLAVPTITGPASVCSGSIANYSTETGMTGYTWNVSSGGIIINGQGTSSITVNWYVAGINAVSVNYIPTSGCISPVPSVRQVEVYQAPVPTISGVSNICPSAGVVYYTEPGMSNYNWSLPQGGIITSGQGTNVITVTWQISGNWSLYVNYSNLQGCTASSPTQKIVTVLPVPQPTITGPTVTGIGSVVVYSTPTGMIDYQWSISAGGTIISGGNTSSILVNWFATGNQSVSLITVNQFGCQSLVPTVLAVSVNPPANVSLSNITIGSGETECYDAVQTITVAGNNTHFIVQSGGSATMIAGQNILYLPGTVVQPGGYMHGYITTTGNYCGTMTPSMITLIAGQETMPETSSDDLTFRLYPNPTEDIFYVETEDQSSVPSFNVEVFTMQGKRIHTQHSLPGTNKLKFSLNGKPTGIYLVRIVTGDFVKSFRVVKL